MVQTAATARMPMWKAGTLNSPSRCRQDGFTLIELTVTLLLITIIVGITLPRIGDAIYSTNLKHSVRQLRAVITLARSKATLERIPRRVVCDMTEGEIRVEREMRDEEAGQVIFNYEPDTSLMMRTYRLPKGVKIEDVITETGEKETSGAAHLRIAANGLVTGNFIHLRKGEQQYTLHINPLTGRVTIEEGYREEFKVAGQR